MTAEAKCPFTALRPDLEELPERMKGLPVDEYEVFDAREAGGSGYLIQMGEPESVEWLACGRPATRDEVMQSIESGLPNLEVIAKQERGGLEALTRAQARFEKWIPKP